MTLEQALAVVNQAMYAQMGRHLSDVEQAVFTGAWQSQTYEQIAQAYGYSVKYLKDDCGRKLWKLLTQVVGEPVGKNNFRSAIERVSQKLPVGQPQPSTVTAPAAPVVTPITPQPAALTSVKTDWGDAIDVSQFYGRSAELTTLTHWIISDRCRLIALLGMGGIGKTALSVKLASQLLTASPLQGQPEFEFVIWRSLRNAPPLDTLLADLVPFLSQQQDTRAELSRLLHWLRSCRVLVILDNLETILQPERVGQFLPGYENYGELLRMVSESNHQSCVICTSREKPAEIAAFEGDDFKVRSLQLGGSEQASEAIVQAKGLVGTDAQKAALRDRYGNSPLALKIVATSIQDLFDGQIGAFLEQDTFIFNGIRRLLVQQFDRLSPLEQSVMYWLAINREWTSIAELCEDMVPAVPKSRLLEAIEGLYGRSLIEKQPGRYTQQSVVMEYVTDRLIEQISRELTSEKINVSNSVLLFQTHALIKTTVKDYIRESQARLIVQPIVNQLRALFRSPLALEQQIQAILNQLRALQPAPSRLDYASGYAAGNLINLCCQLGLDLTEYDFSNLTIWHAHLQGINLHRVSFAGCDLTKSTFTQAFGNVVSVAFSPNGALLATGDGAGGIYLWHIADSERSVLDMGQPFLVLKGHSNWIWSLSFSADGQTLASCSEDQTIRFWDISQGICLRILTGHTGGLKQTFYVVALTSVA